MHLATRTKRMYIKGIILAIPILRKRIFPWEKSSKNYLETHLVMNNYWVFARIVNII